jgi:hypothetical protein
MTMVNNVIGVVNYVIAPALSLFNFVIAGTSSTLGAGSMRAWLSR